MGYPWVQGAGCRLGFSAAERTLPGFYGSVAFPQAPVQTLSVPAAAPAPGF